MFFPAKAENIIVLVDCAQLDFKESLLQPFSKLAKSITKHFPCIFERIYLLNAPRPLKSSFNLIFCTFFL